MLKYFWGVMKMELKKYSAFISSNYNSLRNERAEVIEGLLDAQMIPICMEHFTITSSKNFEDVKKLIEQSDIFIMILGGNYGSCDENGISWTQNEYEYAQSINKISYVLLSEEYMNLKKMYEDGVKLDKKQKKQLKLGESISYPQIITKERNISRIISQIISIADFSNCIGWKRNDLDSDLVWKENNQVLNLSGKWYHVHLKEKNKNYIRIGTVTVKQNFNKDSSNFLKLNAYNYDVLSYDPAKEKIKLDMFKRTTWYGDYYLKDDWTVIGIYESRREFKDKYDDWEVEKGSYRGIHDLNIIDDDKDNDSDDKGFMLQGTFHDVAPSPKMGLVYMFRSEKERFDFLKENFDEVLRSKIK